MSVVSKQKACVEVIILRLGQKMVDSSMDGNEDKTTWRGYSWQLYSSSIAIEHVSADVITWQDATSILLKRLGICSEPCAKHVLYLLKLFKQVPAWLPSYQAHLSII